MLAEPTTRHVARRSRRRGRDQRANREHDAYEDITSDAVAAGTDSIGALKGIGTFLRNRGDINLACLVYAFAAERAAAGPGGAQEAAAGLGPPRHSPGESGVSV